MARATALPMAAAVGPCAVSPLPRKGWFGRSMMCTSTRSEVAELLAKAEAADQSAAPDGLSIPVELARRKERLQKLGEARAKIEARAKERFEREQAEHQAKLAVREAREKATGKKPGGKPPETPAEGPRPTDQINLTDEESASCRFLAVASSSATTLRPSSPEAVCWWLPRTWSRRPTTCSSLSRCWPCPKIWARPMSCLAITAISAPPM